MTENDNEKRGTEEEIYSKVLRAGRRTYFFDVRSTKADDYYLTITESKKQTNENGSQFYKKHKIYLYKEDFEGFKEIFDNVTDFIINEKGQEVISDTHRSDFQATQTEEIAPSKVESNERKEEAMSELSTSSYTDINFEDI